MTRALTQPAEQAKTARTGAPRNILKLEFGGAIGDRFYSDCDLGDGGGLSPLNAQGRVRDWGRISQALSERNVSTIGDCTVELLDADGAMREIFRAVELQRKRATVYQHFEGLGEPDLAPIFVGMADGPVRWEESRAALRFDITDISALHRATVGRLADRRTFPLVAERDEDKALPLVFGRVRRAEAAHAQAGATATLVRACRDSDTKLYVDDASGFPQNQPIQVRMERELIEGHFAGNTFNVTRRGVDLLAGRTTTAAAGIMYLQDSALPGGENEYAGHFIRVTDPDGRTQHRPIKYYSAEMHRISYSPPIICNNHYWTIPAGTTYDITTWARSHAAGTPMYLVEQNFIYILNHAPSRKVHQLFGYGRVIADQVFEDGQKEALDIDGWAPIDPNQFTINRNDTTSFPALGRAVTTATFKHNPKELYPRLRDDRLWADLEGIESAGDGSGELIENPAAIVRCVLERELGLTAGELDAQSFESAGSELSGLKMAFVLDRQWDALRLCADLAFQGRCALLWEDGIARLRVLKNKLGDTAATLNSNNIEEGSVRIARTALSELATEVTARFGPSSERHTAVLRDAAAEAAYGRRARTLDLWAYDDRKAAVSIADFWLKRWKRLYEETTLTAFLNALELQRADAIALDMPSLFKADQKAEVREILHEAGDGTRGRIDRVTLSLRLPVEAGCSATCETECESGGESGCLTVCEAQAESGCWQCETQCETLCELACTTEAELNCIVSDTGGGSWGGCGGCETSCETSCESECQSGCETNCELSCETACESGCIASCEGGCESTAESGCRSGCESGCESTCELQRESASCETGCESSCEVGCETQCETGCETSCELACEATACETGCETTCEVTCETACQSGCESSCQSACEGSCQLTCEAGGCQSGCQTVGESGCLSGCEAACEAGGCQAGCQTVGEAGCTTGCEAACESASCQAGCESSSCQTSCEASCESGCETRCEVACETSCQSGCEVSCETGCETGVEAPPTYCFFIGFHGYGGSIADCSCGGEPEYGSHYCLTVAELWSQWGMLPDTPTFIGGEQCWCAQTVSEGCEDCDD